LGALLWVWWWFCVDSCVRRTGTIEVKIEILQNPVRR